MNHNKLFINIILFSILLFIATNSVIIFKANKFHKFCSINNTTLLDTKYYAFDFCYNIICFAICTDIKKEKKRIKTTFNPYFYDAIDAGNCAQTFTIK